jgi:DNA-binding SARP family transcriptional activator/tetratricopeptide (TPR) repeat protein
MEGSRVEIPLKKAEAALFYMAFEGSANRNRLKTLLWGDRGEELAAGNLRNAVYILRRILPDNFVADRKKLFLERCERDIDGIPDLADPLKPVAPLFFEEPLRGFDMLGISEFDEWISLARNSIRALIADRLRERVLACYEMELRDELKNALSALLSFEPYDEDSVLELMEAWSSDGCVAKAVSIFNAFREKIESEIGVSPSERAQEFFKRLLASQAPADARSPGEFFCGRKREIEEISEALSGKRDDLLIFFIHGEAGVGKTALVSRALELHALENNDVYAARPYQVGEKYPYSSWSGMVLEMGKKLDERGISVDSTTASVLSSVFYDFVNESGASGAQDIALASERNPVMLGRMLAGVVEKLSRGARPVLILEDLHWFDQRSLFLLRAFLSEVAIPLSIFLTSRPEGVPTVTDLLYGLKTATKRRFLQIDLAPFDAAETMKFCRAFLPEDVISLKGDDYFQNKSAGLPLLLVEMLRVISGNPDADPSSGLNGVIMGRMEDLSPLQSEILSVLSVFGVGASVDDLASVLRLERRDIDGSIEELLGKKLVRETQGAGALLLDFLHPNVRECVYNATPGFKKRDIHSRIADVQGARYSPHVWNPALGAILRHHYAMAGQTVQVLRQHLGEMSFYITLNHDLFPLVEDRALLSCSVPFSNREDTEYKIEQASDLLHEINAASPDTRGTNIAENRRMEASYLEIRSGYLISWGEYREGRVFLNRAMKIAKEYGFDEIGMYCLEHVCHHFLQTDDGARLLGVGRDLLRLSKRIGRENHMGMALRFIGMSMLLGGDFRRAESVFRRSMDLFEELGLTGRRYTLNLLASLCYIGEMRQWVGDLDVAMEHFERCIGRCGDAGLFWGRSHFHAHAADTALDMGDWRLVNSHIEAGEAFFDIRRGGRCSSLFYSLKSICDARAGRIGDALESLRLGDSLSSIGKRTWRAPQLMACAWIARMRESGDVNLGGGFPEHESGFYAAAAEKLYRETGASRRANFIRDSFLREASRISGMTKT